MKPMVKAVLLGCIFLTVLGAAGVVNRGVAADSPVLNIGNRLELFVDHYLIERLEGTQLALHRPQPAEVALKFDRPWEGIFCGYVTVIQEGDKYRMYYRGLPVDAPDGSDHETTCYAESRDGVHWVRPNLGLFEVNGTRDNNVVLRGLKPASHNFSPFLDTRPGVAPAERFKALALGSGGDSPSLVALASGDGIHWRKLTAEPVIKEKGWVFDSQNLAFWSGSEGCYVAYYRLVLNHVRSIARTTSKDFLHWSAGVPMSFGDTPVEQFYTNQTAPYFRAPHIYVALAARFMEGRRVLTDDQLREIGLANDMSSLKDDCSEVVFMTTRGGTEYARTFMEAFVRPGIGWQNWTTRTNYAALGVVPTGASEMSLYVQRDYGQATHHLLRYTLRTDGFASVNAPYRGGEMVTKPFKFSGKELVINYSTSAAGSVRVEIQDESGAPIPGYTLGESTEIIGDEIQRVVSWKSGADVSKLAGRALRLRFVMKDADLYSLRFR